MVGLCSWKQSCVEKCYRRCPSDAVCWNNLIFFFLFLPLWLRGLYLHRWGCVTLLPERPTAGVLSGPLWGLLFNPSHSNESEMGLGSYASLKWWYLSCALLDWDAASVMLCSCVQRWTSEEDAEYHLLQAGGRISSAWRVWHRSTCPRGGTVSMWIGHQK